MTNVFVYGTLLYDGVIEALLDKNLESKPAILKGYKRYTKEIPGGNSWGPAIIQEVGEIVKGRVMLDLTGRDLDIFDRYELSADDAYKRITCKIDVGDGQMMEAFTYCANEKIHSYLKGTWSESAFEKGGLDLYINERIPALRKEWNI